MFLAETKPLAIRGRIASDGKGGGWGLSVCGKLEEPKNAETIQHTDVLRRFLKSHGSLLPWHKSLKRYGESCIQDTKV